MKKEIKGKTNKAKLIIFFLLMLFLSGMYAYVYFRFFTKDAAKAGVASVHIQKTIDSMVGRMPIIVGALVLKANLPANTEYIVYSSIKDPLVSAIYSGFMSSAVTPSIPAFTSNARQNERMLSAINHEYVCYPFTDTIGYELLPVLSKYISTVCSTTIPVHQGKFEGFLLVFLSREPTETEKDLIRIESITIAQEAYAVIK